MKHEILYTEEEISEVIDIIAMSLDKMLEGEKVILMPILKGGLFFGIDLARRMKTELVGFDIIGWKSYNDDQAQGVFEQTGTPTEYLPGKKIVLVDDILDSGATMKRTIKYLKHNNKVDTDDIIDREIGHMDMEWT